MKSRHLLITLAWGLGLTLILLGLLSDPGIEPTMVRAASYTVCVAGPPTWAERSGAPAFV